jgi:hypothetical protein
LLIALDKVDVKSIKAVLSQSSFVLPDREDHWIKAIQCFITGEYHKCLLLLFPLLEHGIRVIYVCVNDCENRVLTAGNLKLLDSQYSEKDVLYTTLDILLARTLQGKSTLNKLQQEIGKENANLLYDILYWSAGNRVRDFICHGNVDPKLISKHVTSCTLSLCLSLCVKYCYKNVGPGKLFKFESYAC